VFPHPSGMSRAMGRAARSCRRLCGEGAVVELGLVNEDVGVGVGGHVRRAAIGGFGSSGSSRGSLTVTRSRVGFGVWSRTRPTSVTHRRGRLAGRCRMSGTGEGGRTHVARGRRPPRSALADSPTSLNSASGTCKCVEPRQSIAVERGGVPALATVGAFPELAVGEAGKEAATGRDECVRHRRQRLRQASGE
jgi:hypothetical protein